MRHGSTEASIGTNVQSPIHCSKGILSGTVFSTQMCSLPDDTDDDDDSMLIIVHFQSLYCGLCLMCGLYQRPTHLGGNLAAPGLVLAGGGAGYIWILRAIPCLPPDPSGNPQFGIFFPRLRAQLGGERGRRGETVVQGCRTLGDWWGWVLLLQISENTCLKSAQFCVSIRLLFLFVCVIFCLNNHIVTMLRVQWKDFLRRYWIITNSDQPLADCLSDISLFGYKCWLDPGQAHCHWGPGLSALSWSPDPLESVLFWDRGEVFSPVRLGSGGIRPSFIRFFCFILRFWNQIFTWKATRVSKNILDQFYAHLFLSHSERRVLGNIYLSFIQLKRRCNLYPSRPRQIFIKVKFLLEFC